MALLPLLMLSFSFILSPPLAVATAPSADTLAACSTISSTGTQTLTLATDSLNPGFIYTQSHYWSAANADLYPTCEVFPTTAEEVSSIVSIIQTAGSDVNFAVKSGGHNPNVGYSSTDGGILISMSNLSFTVLSSDQQTVDVGPGARWVQVVEALEPYGVTVVSGRLGRSPLLPKITTI
jgi:FAD/FMN-containing dehydrogenase